MTDFPPATAAKLNLIVNPSGTDPGEAETVMRCEAWWLLDISALWGFPDLVGENVRIPELDGRRAYPKRIDEGVYVMNLVVGGSKDHTGASAANPLQGVRDNIDFLWTNVGRPPASATRVVKVIDADDGEILADAQCRLIPGTLKGDLYTAALELTIPAGRIESPTSSNDNWADAIAFDVTTATVITGNNTGFTLEGAEQQPSAADLVRSAWWKFTPPSDGVVDLDTNGTPFDTVLAVWTGASLAGLSEEASDDDSGIAPNSQITGLNVTNGTTYYIQVGAFTSADPSEGAITLNVGWTP